MNEILETIISNLVDDKDSIHINKVDGERSVVFEVKVAEKDMGKIIGKQGIIAKAIRTIVSASAAKENKRVSVEFLD